MLPPNSIQRCSYRTLQRPEASAAHLLRFCVWNRNVGFAHHHSRQSAVARCHTGSPGTRTFLYRATSILMFHRCPFIQSCGLFNHVFLKSAAAFPGLQVSGIVKRKHLKAPRWWLSKMVFVKNSTVETVLLLVEKSPWWPRSTSLTSLTHWVIRWDHRNYIRI